MTSAVVCDTAGWMNFFSIMSDDGAFCLESHINFIYLRSSNQHIIYARLNV